MIFLNITIVYYFDLFFVLFFSKHQNIIFQKKYCDTDQSTDLCINRLINLW